jgi:serine/threonine protein kinase
MSGIAHRDIEPWNVVKGPRGIRLIDFSHACEHDCLGSECGDLTDLRKYLDLGRCTLDSVFSVWYMIH